MLVRVLVNDKARDGYVSERGLSILVETERDKLLFGMGGTWEGLSYNLRRMGAGIDDIDIVVVSHEHYSQYSGFKYVAWEAPLSKAYVPAGSEGLRGLLAKHGFRVVEVSSWRKLGEGVYVSRPFNGPPFEHYLVIESGESLVVFTGCLHPGADTLRDVSSHFNKPIGLLIGGLHLSNLRRELAQAVIDKLLNDIGVRRVAPLHCSGGYAEEYISNKYPQRIIKLRAGDVLEVEGGVVELRGDR